MKRLPFFLLVLPLLVCAQQKTKYPNSVLINAKLECSGTMTDSAVRKCLGVPDSVSPYVADCSTYFDRQDSLAYFRSVVLEKSTDSFTMHFIEFYKSIPVFVQFGSVKLNASTTIEDVLSYYQSIDDLTTSEINDRRTGLQVEVLSFYINADNENARNNTELWHLIFHHNKLIRLEAWNNC